jgi:hypothetical protein
MVRKNESFLVKRVKQGALFSIFLINKKTIISFEKKKINKAFALSFLFYSTFSCAPYLRLRYLFEKTKGSLFIKNQSFFPPFSP